MDPRVPHPFRVLCEKGGMNRANPFRVLCRVPHPFRGFSKKNRGMNGMKNVRPPEDPENPSEDGYVLIAVIFMLALFIIALAVAAPARRQVHPARARNRDHAPRQTIHARAVKLYYRRFGRYPPNVDALVNTNEMRFLRKKYIDPTSGKEDWKPIAVGMNKTQATGFFGKPIVGSGGSNRTLRQPRHGRQRSRRRKPLGQAPSRQHQHCSGRQ
jgi:hypothetical protein